MAFRSPSLLATALFLLASVAQGQHRTHQKAAPPVNTQVQTGPVKLTPAIVESGSPELLRVRTPYLLSRVEGEWLGRKLQFFPNRDRSAWFALAGVDVEAHAGPS